MLKHKIEKFDVRRFMGLLERSKLARYSSFCEPLYFSFRSSRAPYGGFLLPRSLPGCLSLKRNLSPLLPDLHPVFTLFNVSYRFATCAMIYHELPPPFLD